MQSTSEAYDIAIRATTREMRFRATIETETNSIDITEADLASGGFSFNAACFDNDFSLGGAKAASCTLILTNHDKQWDDIEFEGGTVWPYVGIVTGHVPEGEPDAGDPIVEYILMGTFVIDRQSRPYATITLEAADRLMLLDVPLIDMGFTFPISGRDALTAISTRCLIPLATNLLDFDQLDEIQLQEPDQSGVTCRDVVQELALLCGGFARCTRTGQLEIVSILPLEEGGAYEMTASDRGSFKVTAEPITLTGIQYKDNILGDDAYALNVNDLRLVDDLTVMTHLQAVWLLIEGYTYVPFDAHVFGNPAIDTADTIKHITRDDETVLSLVGKLSYRFRGRSTMSAGGRSRSEQKYANANARRIAGVVAGLERRVETLVSQYALASANMAEMVGLMMGVFPSQEIMPDGSTVYYWHNKPAREDSDIIWMFNGLVFATSDDGGDTWTGQTADGTVLARQLIAEGALIGSASSEYTTTIRPNAFKILYRDMPVMSIIEDEMRIPKTIASEYLGVGRTKFVPLRSGGEMVGTGIVFLDDPAGLEPPPVDNSFSDHVKDLSLHNSINLRLYRLNADIFGKHTLLEWRRGSDTLAITEELSGGTAPYYTTLTRTYYEDDGVTVRQQNVWSLTYDGDGDLVSME